MARKSKVIEIDGLGEVTVKEASPYAVYSALNAKNKIEHLLVMAENCIDMNREKMQKLYPSEIEAIVEAFIEVNKSFLAIAEKFGLKNTITSALEAMTREMPKHLQPLFAASFKTVMDKELGTTGGATS